ncbi:hypothetical protein Agub_g6606 [Astrephomene gubernaculifera]|uniref:Uncharacterized protein n=1 Tax=Astrephomene gubernaculifera TaxID=47775 RepID=A0AAD3DSR1_9CHLO|nr:hypothetical protein Agub_g6606 [Astrephomene gubernaculifera]
MPNSVARTSARRGPSAFLSAGRCSNAKRPKRAVLFTRNVIANGSHSDPVGTADAAAGRPIAPQPSVTQASATSMARALPDVAVLFCNLRNHATSLAQRLALAASSAAAAVSSSNGLPQHPAPMMGLGLAGRPMGAAATLAGLLSSGTGPTTLQQLLRQHQQWETAAAQHSHHHQQQQALEEEAQWDDEHLWSGPHAACVPWDCGEPLSQSFSASHYSLPTAADDAHDHSSSSTPMTSAASSSSAVWILPIAAFPPHWRLPDVPDPSSLPSTLHTQLAGLGPLWHSVTSVQHRTAMAAIWYAGRTLHAAERYIRTLPSPHEMPGVMSWAATSAAVQAEESVVLAMAHLAAAAASAATASVPAKATSAAASAIAVRHLTLVRQARRRLLAAAAPLLGELHDLRQGCSTHVLLRFVLFSALQPELRRDLIVRLDVLAHRAVQLALLQEQYERLVRLSAAGGQQQHHHQMWLKQRQQPQRQPTQHPAVSSGVHDAFGRLTGGAAASASAAALTSSGAAGASSSSSSSSSSAAAAPGSSPPSDSAAPALSARWYRRVFAPEMLACRRQLLCGWEQQRRQQHLMREVRALRSGAADGGRSGEAAEAVVAAAQSDPPGRFDLRDLYRLIRVIEVAIEDLEREEEEGWVA